MGKLKTSILIFTFLISLPCLSKLKLKFSPYCKGKDEYYHFSANILFSKLNPETLEPSKETGEIIRFWCLRDSKKNCNPLLEYECKTTCKASITQVRNGNVLIDKGSPYEEIEDFKIKSKIVDKEKIIILNFYIKNLPPSFSKNFQKKITVNLTKGTIQILKRHHTYKGGIQVHGGKCPKGKFE